MSDCRTIDIIRARKDHYCECHRDYGPNDPRGFGRVRPCEIKRGERYQRQSGVSDGSPFRLRLCLFHAAVCTVIFRRQVYCHRGVDLSELAGYVEPRTFEEWRGWLVDIRAEYRKLKESR